MPDDVVLEVSSVCKSFGDRRAVSELSFDVRRGEVFGLLGPNGAGKSTTIGMAVGLLAPDAGRVRVLGEDPAIATARSNIGLAPQSLAIYEELSAAENLAFYASIYGLAGTRQATRVAELLALVGLTDRAHGRVAEFSGGMKRRLNLAAALVHDPPLLMLDEPTVGVDPQSRNAIFELIQALRSQGRSILYTTHYMEEAQKLCDRVGIVDHGRMLALDSVDALIGEHGGESVVRIHDNDGEREIRTSDPARELTAVLARGDVRSVRVDRPDLQTVFLSLTGRSLRE